MCAVEIEIGAGFPTPEKFLFQHVMSKPNAQRTMLGAKRWAAEDSLAADLIEEACPQDELFDRALAFAEEQSRLHAAARHGEDALQSTLKACQAELAKAKASETKLEQSKLEVCSPP